MATRSPRVRLPGRHQTLRQRESRTGLLLISPTFVLVVVMVIVPVLWAISLSLQRIRLSGIRNFSVTDHDFTLRNFERVLGSSTFTEALKTTLLYSILGTTGAILLGLGAALCLRDSFRGRGLVRSLMLLPYVAPVVAVAFVWVIMLNPQFGIVNAIGTEYLGWQEGVPFTGQEHGTLNILGLEIGVPTSLLVIIAFEAWRSFPFAFLFIIARLQALPRDVDEAADVDGATPWQHFRYVTLPQLAGVIALIALLRLIWTFNSFDEVYLLTGGGAGTEVLGVQVYNYLTARNDVGGAAAVSMIMAGVLTIFVLIYMRFFAERGIEEGR